MVCAYMFFLLSGYGLSPAYREQIDSSRTTDSRSRSRRSSTHPLARRSTEQGSSASNHRCV